MPEVSSATSTTAAASRGGAPVDPTFTAPQIAMPKGGGALRGIGEKFTANAVTGTGSVALPIAVSPGRSGFGPQLTLTYDSGAGNGPFGIGWSLGSPAITRKTDKGLPRYLDDEDSDVFILSGAEDLVPQLRPGCRGGKWLDEEHEQEGHRVRRYRPRVEGLFARIERWTRLADGDVHWRSLSRENVLTVYGEHPESRIADPDDPRRVFSWLICRSHDDRGNAIQYEYVPEDGRSVDLAQAHERHRKRTAQRYLKRIRYGNRRPLPRAPAAEELARAGWMFEVVLDYGEGHYREEGPDADGFVHAAARAELAPTAAWPSRKDPFSTYRSGFEVRSYRLCRRILMFHRFAEELGVEACLVRSTDLGYREKRIGSFLTRVTPSGYRRRGDGRSLRKSMPAVEMAYTTSPLEEAFHDDYDVAEVAAGSLANLPEGIDGRDYRWIDLDGEGIAGVLTEQGSGWFYKHNLGKGRLGPTEPVATQPSLAQLGSGRQELVDVDGDGRLDLVQLGNGAPGFYPRLPHDGWANFRAFDAIPNRDWRDPNLRFVDVTGDGIADVLVTEGETFIWHPSLLAEGYGRGRRVEVDDDEESGPRVLFADREQAIYLADMSGDGLSDIVRVRNGEICYWPNTGYGCFGAKITMENPPWLEDVNLFDQTRLRLADTDGSGTTDLLYLGKDGTRIYLNQAGNRWSSPRVLSRTPRADNLTSVSVVDFLGRGTACLLWSSPLPGDAGRSLRYLDLMKGRKPHLLRSMKNNLGTETIIEYASSTRFYLADKAAGRPWITSLPFPVQVVERVETLDRVGRNRFVTRYAYHHGYFDGVEREFRGFGLVEQWDTEELAVLQESDRMPAAANIDASSHVPPVLTKTWFHTGVCRGSNHVSDFYAGLPGSGRGGAGEYYRPPGLTDEQASRLLLDDTELPDGLTACEEREACRALKGGMLRQEIYALDGTAKAATPYVVTEGNFTVVRLQPRGGNLHAVFHTHHRETLTSQYERNPEDPRIVHALTLEVDRFGDVLKSMSIGYGRRRPDPALPVEDQEWQRRRLVTYTESYFTNAVETTGDHRTPLPARTRTYEITGFRPGRGFRFTPDEARAAGADAGPIGHEERPTPGVLQKRLIDEACSLYRRDDLTGPLPPGELQGLALPYETYKLALTPAMVAAVYGGRVDGAMLENDCRYVHLDGDDHWWLPSGRIFFSPGSGDTPAQELAYARRHFFLARRYRNAFYTEAASTESFVRYDRHDLLLVETGDALGNRIAAAYDYRVLMPRLVTDANRNRFAAAFDALGMTVGTAVMGKRAPAAPEGDSLDGFETDLPEAVVREHLAHPLAHPSAILRDASARTVYDFFAYQRTAHRPDPQPAVVYSLARETHAAAPMPADGLKVQHRFTYADGFGREIQQKIQAAPGQVDPRVRDGDRHAAARWIATGWTIFNNKGKPVRRYEPFFTDTPRFEFDVRAGGSPILFYDPVERIVATLRPNRTWEKVVFDGWRQENWDVNDTVLVRDPRHDPEVGHLFRRLPETDYLPTWYEQRAGGELGPLEQAAARKTALHAATPTVAHTDALGRVFLTVAHNRRQDGPDSPGSPVVEEFLRARTFRDIEGNEREVRDAVTADGDPRGRLVARYDHDLLGNRLRQASMEAGERWTLADAGGKPLLSWDSRGHRFRNTYDRLQRAADAFLHEQGAGAERLVGRMVYGEAAPDPEAGNLRGRPWRSFDQAGTVSRERYDFKGNLLRSRRQLARLAQSVPAYRTTVDWSGPVELEADAYETGTTYDALNRPVELTTPDRSVIRQRYNASSLLDRVETNLRGATGGEDGAPVWSTFVRGIAYDARLQRASIEYGNGARTAYDYDPLTFFLRRLVTLRARDTKLQDLHYTYDPAGNVSHLRDDAQQSVYFRNRRVDPDADYTYDALYRLIEATGREHLGQAGGPPVPASYDDFTRIGLPDPGDGDAMGRYLERYHYDGVGNFLSVEHRGGDPAHPGWTRHYHYAEPSALEPSKHSNRLTRTAVGQASEVYSTDGGGYDAHGNMRHLPQLHRIRWDFRDQLHMTQRQAVNAGDADGAAHRGERTWYVYDMSGVRVRKVTELASGQLKDERVYLGGFEIYRRHGSEPLTRETLHLFDDKQRIALVETRTLGKAADDPAPAQVIRYQLGNHLGSVCLELDDEAKIISYEEYTPFGSSAYQAVRRRTELPKRYRFSGKERDEETGLYYYGARYYASWLGRWTSPDPKGIAAGINPYVFVVNNPVRLIDPDGRDWRDSLSPMQRAALWVDEAIVQKDPGTRGVVMNLERRGDALMKAPQAIADTYHAEGLGGVARGMGKGVEHLFTDTVDAAVDVGYYGAKAVVEGDPQAMEKVTSRSLDIVLNIADIVTLADGVGSAKNAVVGGGKMLAAGGKSVATTVKDGMTVLRDGALVPAEGVMPVGGGALAATANGASGAAVAADAAKGTGQLMSQAKNMGGGGGGAKPNPGGVEPPKPKGDAHHLATDKNTVSTARGGPWTPRFEKILSQAGLDISKAEENLVNVPGHAGPHPQAYHEYVFDRLTTATEGLTPNTPAYRQAVTGALNDLGAEARTPGSQVNNWLTKKGP